MAERQAHLSRHNFGRDLASEQPPCIVLVAPVLAETQFALQVHLCGREYSQAGRNQGGNKTAHSSRTVHESLSYMPEPLDSRQLRAFASLARTGSFTQTARELRLSQSAISHSMKALEQEVRCRLLDRMG